MKYYDPFVFDSIETITSVEFDSEFALIEFTNTIFYPGGGGQPRDYGEIVIRGEKFEVLDIIKDKSIIKHKIKTIPQISIYAGILAELRINRKRREQLMRMHTGEHLFMGSMLKLFPEIKVDKVDLDEEESSVYVIPPNNVQITWNDIFKAEEIANKIILENRNVSIHLASPEDVERRFPQARIKLDRIKSDTIRIIEIDAHDFSACAGIHCSTTGFIGNFIVTKFNKTGNNYEIRFKVNSLNSIFELARFSREVSSELKINPSELLNFSKTIINEKNELKEKLRVILSSKELDIIDSSSKDFILKYAVAEGLDKKQTTDKLNEIYEDISGLKKAVVLFNVSEKGTQFFLRISEFFGDVSEIIKALSLKGGGRGNYASGMCEDNTKFISELKNYFSK